MAFLTLFFIFFFTNTPLEYILIYIQGGVFNFPFMRACAYEDKALTPKKLKYGFP